MLSQSQNIEQMPEVRVIELNKSVFDANDRQAEELRAELRARGQLVLNLMSSPGSGKTSLILSTLERLGPSLSIAVMEADIAHDVDARRLAAAGAQSIQLHTNGMCHLDAGMTRRGLEELGARDADLIFLENVGNLVCPAEFDTGASKSAMILSVPEGDDKPLKYPLMFEMVDAVVISKTDVASRFDFDFETCALRIAALNPRAKVIPVSAKTGEGMGAWCAWLSACVEEQRAGLDKA